LHLFINLFKHMKKSSLLYTQFFRLKILLLLVVLGPLMSNAQTVTSDPALPTDGSPVTIYFNAAGTALEGFAGDVYAHTGVMIQGLNTWQHVIGVWGNNTSQPKLERVEANKYKLVIAPSIRQFYNVPASQIIRQMAFVFRAAVGSLKSVDLFVDVYESETLGVSIINPPKSQPIVEGGAEFTITAASIASTSLSLYINEQQVATSTTEAVGYSFSAEIFGPGTHWIWASATADNKTVYDSTYIFIRPAPEVAELPLNVIPGINYINETTVTLVLHDPPAKKNYVFVIGDFNNWMVSADGYMNVTPAGNHFWITLTNLTPDTEYGFQYFIDNEIRIADPYTEKVLDPSTDQQIISEGRYPGLIPYPYGKTENPASVIHPGRKPYQWQTTNFTPPAVEDLVIYELLIRDFLPGNTNTYKGVREKLQYLKDLGVNAIELLPITNFEGNLSWGYNPSFFFAADKYYGPRDELKKLIDEAHGMGIAVILDMVWNHSFSQSPLLQMYFDRTNNKLHPDNPWYSQPIFQNTNMNFGYKFNHGSQYFIDFMDRSNAYWLNEFKVDGFRFDLTKGFTTKFKGSDDEWGSKYDQERVNNLVRLHNHIKSVNPDAYVIIEHLADNSEEKVLANAGLLLWGNMNHNYNEATMGWHENNKSNLSWGSYKAREWNNPNLITYMESHDEERLMVKNLKWGNASGTYNIKDLSTSLERIELAAAFFFTIPGPKMIWQFGELGYDVSIDFNGRTGVKPVRWDYFGDWKRRNVYTVFSLLIDLKKEHDVFRTTDYTLAVGSTMAQPGKRIHLNHPTNPVTVLGNFGVTETTFVPNFQSTGTWYEYFSRNTLVVNDLSTPITLKAGEYRLYSKVEFPDHGIDLGVADAPVQGKNRIEVFPNPSERGFNFSLETNKNWHIQIVNMQGQIVYEKQNAIGPANSHFYWNTSNLSGYKAPQGIYFYNIFSADESMSGKIMIK
jgi:1,4-alpha-glucan branching enzyme